MRITKVIWAFRAELTAEQALLRRLYHCGTRPLLAPFHFKFNGLAFMKPVEIELLQATAMEEDLLSIRRPDKPESAISNDSFNRPLHRHLDVS